jgi:hypothetical protein
MRTLLAVACLSVAMAGCSGADTSNPVAACNSFISAACNKQASCPGEPSASTCITNSNMEIDCSTQACPTGTTYNSGAVNQCLNDINNTSCPFTTPSSCNSDNFCT